MKKKNTQTERYVRNKLYKELGGHIEVVTEVGNIDLLTDTEVIEVKHVKNWKHGLGQILVYDQALQLDGIYRTKRLHLFGFVSPHMKTTILNHCDKVNILVTWENELM